MSSPNPNPNPYVVNDDETKRMNMHLEQKEKKMIRLNGRPQSEQKDKQMIRTNRPSSFKPPPFLHGAQTHSYPLSPNYRDVLSHSGLGSA